MKRPELRGVGTVFRYTFVQHYKMKSVIILLTVLFALSLALFPLVLIVSGGNKEVSETEITRLYIRNETDIPFVADLLKADERYRNTEVILTDTSNESLAQILWDEEHSAAAVVSEELGGMSYRIKGYYGQKSQVSSFDTDTVVGLLEDCLHDSILKSLDATQEQADLARSHVYSEVMTAEKAMKPASEEVDTGTHVFVNIFYCYLTLILCVFAMNYIFQYCLEEKVSKLAETLMVSVSPTALLVGKIAAATCMVFIGVGLVVFGLCISWQIAGMIGDTSALLALIENQLSFRLADLHFTPAKVLLIVFCMLLSYAIVAFFAGICGSCCSKTEDVQQASVTVVFFIMIGYMVSAFIPMSERSGANIFSALFPPTAIFSALPNYICGKISGGIFLLSLLIQIVTAVFLARAAGATYRMMMLYRGSVPKPAQLIKMIREERAAQKAARSADGKGADA